MTFETAPRIGMGCWAIGGPFWDGERACGYAGADDATSRAALRAAWQAGIRVFDTAAVYGTGHSESLVGEVLADEEDAMIVSKVGLAFDAESKRITGPRFDAGYVEAAVDASRRRLRRDRVDVMLLHLNELPVADAARAFDAMEALRERGWIGAYGWSTDFWESARAMAGRNGFEVVQHAMNVFVDAPSMCEAAREGGLAQMIRSPLAMGLLAGGYGGGRKVAADDVRNHSAGWNDYFTGREMTPRYAEMLERVRELLTTGGRTLGQGALCWLLAKGGTIVPVPGARTPQQAEENAGALSHGPLPAEVMAEIETVLDRTPEGPARAR